MRTFYSVKATLNKLTGTMNRFDRITAILIQLQSRKVVRAQDLAEHFNISLRTVYRDINSLSEAGIPIIGEAGVGYSIMDGYRLPPVMFTNEEARTFITAEKLMGRFTDFSTQRQYQSAMFKIKSVLKSTEKNMVENLENHIEIRRNYNPSHPPTPNALDVLLKSISERKAVSIHYKTMRSDEISERLIEPVGVYHENDNWYTIAYCHLRKEYRNFRSDRIQKIEVTDHSFDLLHAPLKDFLERQVGDDKNLQLIVIRVDSAVAPYIREQKYYYGFVSEVIENGQNTMTFLSAYLDNFARWYLMIAPNATIIEPPALTERLKALVEKISQKINN
jgi:predicted DNA-binding transcriptional regulator YafY